MCVAVPSAEQSQERPASSRSLELSAGISCYYLHSISYLQRDFPEFTNPQNISVRTVPVLSHTKVQQLKGLKRSVNQ